MRRSICYCEPNYALAGNSGNWKFIYTTSTLLPKGTKLRFDMQSKGRPIDWQIPQTNLKKKENLIWVEIPEGKTLQATAESPYGSYEFTLPTEIKPGENVEIHIGSSNACQKTTQRRRPFLLYIDTKGKGEYKEQPEIFGMDVRGNQLHNLRVIAPSLVARNRRFDVIVRFEDKYGNLTCNAPEGTLIDLSYENLRENLNWKLFIPETGFIALPNLYFNEAGLYKIKLRNMQTQETFLSSPIRCLSDSPLSLYWGTLHGEWDRTDSAENIESYLRYVRDEKALQFVATSCFDTEEETSNDVWKLISNQIAEFNEDDRFVALLGFQWQGEPKTEGLRHFIYTKDNKPLLRRKDTKNNSLKKIYKTNNPKELLSLPLFTMGKTTSYDFEDFTPEYERVVEIYNSWGSSECTAKAGNPCPISGTGKNSIGETAEGSLRKALNNGCRFGFSAGGYDDRGAFEQLYDADQVQYPPGITAILAKEHSRSSLIEALQNRSCYATTGEKIILSFNIAQFPMGSEVDTKTRPGLEYNRHISGFAIGTKPITEAVIIRNGEEWVTLEVKDGNVEFEVDDGEMLSQIALSSKREDALPFAYYYLRVMQEDGHIAWGSPIWVVQHSKKLETTAPAKKPRKK